MTRDLSTDILHGITRSAVLRLAEEAELPIEERSFTPQEAYDAAEVFATGSSFFVLPVVEIDGHIISNRAPAPLTNRLREMYIEMATN